jgi:MFS family permease
MPQDPIVSAAADAPRRVHYAWVVVLAGAAAIFCGLGLGRFAFGMLLPSMSASLGLTHAEGGLLGFANMAGYLSAVLLVPRVLSRFGTRATTTASLLLIAASMAGMALTEGYVTLCGLYLLTGLGTGGVVLPAMSVLSQWFRPSHRGLASGMAMAGPGFGIIFSGFIVPRLLPVQGLSAWQAGWLIFAVITLCVAGLVAALIRNHPDQRGLSAFGRFATPTVTRPVFARSARLRLLAHMGLLYGIYGATYMLYVTFIVTTMMDSYGLSEPRAGALWAWFGGLSIFSGVLFGWLSDRIGRRGGLAIAFGMLALAYLLVGLTDWRAGLYLSVVLFGLAAWSVPVIMAASAGDFFGASGAAKALAVLTFAFSGGQAMGPLVAGYLAESSGSFAASYAGAGAAALVALALAMVLRPPQTAD